MEYSIFMAKVKSYFIITPSDIVVKNNNLKMLNLVEMILTVFSR